MSANLWNLTRGLDSFGDLVQRLTDTDHDTLAKAAANTVLNDWCSGVADFEQGDRRVDPHGFGRRLPYLGWYWRSVDFARPSITVGDCGNFIGFMENNKWGHPERDLNDDEAAHVINLLWRARTESNRGGRLSDALDARDAVLGELWGWMQDLDGLKRWDE